jgi:hypothetical protein
MNQFNQILAAEKDFFAYFGCDLEKSGYSKRHTILDFREYHWRLVESDQNTPLIYWAPEPFTAQELDSGEQVYCEDVLIWLGANTQSGTLGGIWRGTDFTLIASGLSRSLDRHFLLFSNANECCDHLYIMNISQTLA